MQALDRRTGETLWTFSSGGPLVRAHADRAAPAFPDAADDDDDDAAARGGGFGFGGPASASAGGGSASRPATVFPGVDGSLFALADDSVVTRLPVTAAQLVEASPSMTRDGALVVGGRSSLVFALDAKTGALLKTVDADGVTTHARHPSSGEDHPRDPREDPREDPRDPRDGDGDDVAIGGSTSGERERAVVYLGRTEYAVRSVDASTGRERWNVTYAELRPIANPAAFERAVATGGGLGALGGYWPFTEGVPRAVKPAGTAPAGSSFALGPGNEVRSLGGGTGASSTDRRWSARTSSVPLGAFDRTGARYWAAAGASSTTADERRRDFRRRARGGLYALPRAAGSSPDPDALDDVPALVGARREAERRRRPRALVVRARGARVGRVRRETRTWRPYGGARAGLSAGGSRPSSGTPTPRVSRRRRRPLRAPPPDRSPSRSSRPRRRYRPSPRRRSRSGGFGFSGCFEKKPGHESGGEARPGVGREGRGRGGVAAARRSRRATRRRGRKRRRFRGSPEEEEEEGPGPLPTEARRARAREAGAAGARSGRSRRRTATLPVPSRARRVRVRRGWGACRCTSPRRSGTVRAGRSCSPGSSTVAPSR